MTHQKWCIVQPIENIKSGDIVWSFDPETLEVSQNYVDQVLVHKSNDLVKITIGNEIITATSNHPFYVVTKGFISALELRAGDILITVNGERVVVEKVQHEILEAPVDVYNFSISSGSNIKRKYYRERRCQCNIRFYKQLKLISKISTGEKDRGSTFVEIKVTPHTVTVASAVKCPNAVLFMLLFK